MNEKDTLKGIGLQFFADPPADPPQDPPADPPQDPPADPPAGKTFTQEEVNRMLANEKRQGRQAALKALGLDPADKDAEKKAKEILDGHKTQAERDAEALKTEQTARSEAEKKAEAAERKFAVLSSGCKKEFVEEVTALATVKVTETVDFEAALKTVKEKFPNFFDDDSDDGTGGGQGHRRQKPDTKPGAFGSRLAQSVVSANPKENPYFKH